jgi:DNA-binding NarL/FixJ family response regulator
MVVDDSLPFASAVAQFLAREGRFEVLASAHSGSEALARAPIERPDLMLVDVSMPGMDGLAVTARIKALEAPPKVVMMTLEDSEKHRSGAVAAGADGFLSKNDFARDLPKVVTSLFVAPRS